jgi:hypothetical protein
VCNGMLEVSFGFPSQLTLFVTHGSRILMAGGFACRWTRRSVAPVPHQVLASPKTCGVDHSYNGFWI